MLLNYRDESNSTKNSEVELDIDLESLILPNQPNPNWKRYLLFAAGCLGMLFLIVAFAKDRKYTGDFFVQKDGKPELAPERKAKLQKELDEVDEAEQYALYATEPGYYPCFTCYDGKTLIWLNELEIWKYGHTRKGDKNRYRNGYPDKRLGYQTQFIGTLSECVKEEKRKIYS